MFLPTHSSGIETKGMLTVSQVSKKCLAYLITSRASGKECFVKMPDTEQSSKIGILTVNQVNEKFFANATDKTCRVKKTGILAMFLTKLGSFYCNRLISNGSVTLPTPDLCEEVLSESAKKE